MLGGAGRQMQQPAHRDSSGITPTHTRTLTRCTCKDCESVAFLTHCKRWQIVQSHVLQAQPKNSSPKVAEMTPRCRIAVGVALLHAALGYAPPTTRARQATRLAAKKIDFVVEEESRDFLDVSSVFLDSFWADKAGAKELTAAQRRELRSGQLDDFRRRYALRRDTRRKATLFVAKDGATIIGCAGVELDGAADDANLIPVLSNVATAREGRRRGVATILIKEAEKRVKEWGCTEMDLVVEESNKPARNLYSKLGYSVVSKDTASDTLVPTDDGRIAKQTTTTLTMRRDLNGGGAALLPVAGAVVIALGGFAYINLF